MILKILGRLSYLVLIFGFFYGTYHFGLMKGKQHERGQIERIVLNETKGNETFGGARNNSTSYPPSDLTASPSPKTRAFKKK